MSNTPIDRRHEILDSLHAHLRARTRRRRAVRAVAAGLPVAMALALVVWLGISPTPDSPRGTDSALAITPSPQRTDLHVTGSSKSDGGNESTQARAHHERVILTIAASEPLPMTPCESPSAATVCILNDDQLLAALAEAGQPSGIVRTRGEAFVIPNGTRPQ